MARRPKTKSMEKKITHSNEHKGDAGKFGNIYKKDVPRWKPKDGEHEFCIFPYFHECEENSIFRTSNPDFNLPFTDEEIKEGETWDYKLSVLVHTNVGVNQDTVVCPRTIKKECPICKKRQHYYDLFNEEKDKDEAIKLEKKAKALAPSKKAIYNIVCFDNEEEFKKGIQVWEAPAPSIEDVCSEKMVDKRTGDKRIYSNPEEGWNVWFDRRKDPGDLFSKYKTVDIVARREKEDFSEEELDALYEQAYDLESIVELVNPEDLEVMIEGTTFEDPEEGGSSDHEERPRNRFNNDNANDKDEKPESSERFRGNRKPKSVEPEPESEPEFTCEHYGKKANQLNECESCPDDMFEECYKACEKAAEKEEKKEKPKTKRPGR